MSWPHTTRPSACRPWGYKIPNRKLQIAKRDDRHLPDALKEAAQQLEQAKVDSPRLAAELLLAHALGVSRTQLLAGSGSPSLTCLQARHLATPSPACLQARHLVTLSPGHLAIFHSLVERCAGGEPLAYVLGHKEFYDLDLACDSRALIPRPETELLVETVLNKYQISNCKLQTPALTCTCAKAQRRRECVTVGASVAKIADIGTGSGCVALTLAAHRPEAVVYAVDVSADALGLARQNAQRCGLAGRITFLQGDLLEPLPEAVNVIAANLPYVTTPEWEVLPSHIRLHEPRLALDGGRDGLELVRRLLAQAPGRLLPGGLVALEIGAAQGQAVLELARTAFPAARVELKQDYAGLDRLVVIETYRP
jgi:release factor glutamine methyltransferase